MATRNKSPADIRQTFKRYRLPLAIAARIDDCRRLCAGWHNRFGACLTLDNDRLRALCKRLVDDGFNIEDCVWAVEAYHQHCQTDAWHQKNPGARKTIAAFFADDRFEEWVEKGRELSCRRQQKVAVDQTTQQHKRTELAAARDQADRDRRIREWFESRPDSERADLLAQAWQRIPTFLHRVHRSASIDNRSIRAEVGKMMEESSQLSALSSQSKGVTP